MIRNGLLAPSGCCFGGACSPCLAPCAEVTEIGDINGNIMCWCFGMIIARCDTDGKSSRTRKMHLFWLHTTHTHTHTGHELGKVRGRQRRGNMERQWRGKTTTQIAAGRDAAEYIFDEWTACCTLSTLLILMAQACYNKSMFRQVMARWRWRLHTHVNTPSQRGGMEMSASEGVKAHGGRKQQPNSLFWLNFKCLSWVVSEHHKREMILSSVPY